MLVFFASIIGTVTGFGVSTMMIPVVLLLLPITETLLLVGIINFLEDIWKIILFKKGIKWKLIIAFALPGMFFSYLGARIVLEASSPPLLRILGAFLISYAIFIIGRPAFTLSKKWWSAAAGGSLSGFTAGLFGMGGVVRSAFLSAYNLPKSVYIFTIGVVALFIDLSRLLTYYSAGVRIDSRLWWGMLFFIPATFMGAVASKRMIKDIPQGRFRLVVVFFLLVFGIKLLFFPG